MRRITSALFIDFDNIFSGLLDVERTAAMSLVDHPQTFIERLEAPDPEADLTRSIRVRKAYLNPDGKVRDPALDASADKIPLALYRKDLMRAGFEVIDCPTLAKGQKNAADIRMVIDVLDLVAGPVRVDEIILASKDSDFTPLLIKLRALGHRTTILATGNLATAYEGAADRLIGEADLVALLTGRVVPPVETPRKARPEKGSAERRALDVVASSLAEAKAPIRLTALGHAIKADLSDEIKVAPKWFGRTNLTGFIRFWKPQFEVDDHWVWDPGRHKPPVPAG